MGRVARWLGVLAIAGLVLFVLAHDPLTSSSLTVRNLTGEPLRDVIVAFPNHSERHGDLPAGGKLVVYGHSGRGDEASHVEGMRLAYTYRGHRRDGEFDYLVETMPAEHCDVDVVGDRARLRCCHARLWITSLACPANTRSEVW